MYESNNMIESRKKGTVAKDIVTVVMGTLTLASTAFTRDLQAHIHPIPPSEVTPVIPQRDASPAQRQWTTFQCVPGPSGIELTGSRGQLSVPLIIFTEQSSIEFGEAYGPESRCDIVRKNFTKVVDANAGTMRNVLLTHGPVHGRQVICSLGPGEDICTAQNQLFTLNSTNERQPGRMLGKLLQASRAADTSAVIFETQGRTVVDLGEWEENNLVHAAVETAPRYPDPVVPAVEEPIVRPEPPTPVPGGGFSGGGL